ncbi:MAG: OmpA family protein [Planctomycetaceae bacterium]|jgi:flagellar motor protein MotB|nr:OmpA family protein [Planctomycetaceae bacterium]
MYFYLLTREYSVIYKGSFVEKLNSTQMNRRFSTHSHNTILTILILTILIFCLTGCRTASNNTTRLFSAPSTNKFNPPKQTQPQTQPPLPPTNESILTPTSPTSPPSPLTPTSNSSPINSSPITSSPISAPAASSDKFHVNTTNFVNNNSPPFFAGSASIADTITSTQPVSNTVKDPSILDNKRYEAFRPIIPHHIAESPAHTVNSNINVIPETIIQKESPIISQSEISESNELNELKKQVEYLETELKKNKEQPKTTTQSHNTDNNKQLTESTTELMTVPPSPPLPSPPPSSLFPSSSFPSSIPSSSSPSSSSPPSNADLEDKEKHLSPPSFNVKGVTTTKDNKGIVRIAIVDSLLFMNTAWKLKPEAEELLRRIITEIQAAYPEREINIEGHTDNLDVDPKNPTQKHDIAALKAGVVIDYCVKILKCNPAKMTTISSGSKYPVDDNSTAEGRANNNRIEIVIIPPDKRFF